MSSRLVRTSMVHTQHHLNFIQSLASTVASENHLSELHKDFRLQELLRHPR